MASISSSSNSPWHGPSPTPTQRLLLAACMEPDHERALAAWREWCDHCDFEREDGASHELASLLVAKLGVSEAGGGIASRSLGWYRRAWFLSELAAAAANSLAEVCHKRGIQATAIGDLACWLSTTRFAGRRLPIRSIELFVPSADRRLCRELHELALSGPAGDGIRGRQIGLRIIPLIGDRLVAATAASATPRGDLALPSAGAQIAHLAARNWCWDPPQKLRWMMEIFSIVQARADDEDLSTQMGVVIAQADAGWSTERALLALRAVISGQAQARKLDPLIAAAAARRGGLTARSRGLLRLSPFGPSLSRCQFSLSGLNPRRLGAQ